MSVIIPMPKIVSLRNQNERLSVTLTQAHIDYKAGMRNFAFYKTQDSALSEDLVQDTFSKAWRYLVRTGNVKLMKPFLYHILRYLIIDEYRKRKNISLDTLIGSRLEPYSDDYMKDYYYYDAELAAKLIDRLPNNYRQVIFLRYIKGLSPSEIATITHQTENSVAVQSHRGLKKLRLIYDKQSVTS